MYNLIFEKPQELGEIERLYGWLLADKGKAGIDYVSWLQVGHPFLVVVFLVVFLYIFLSNRCYKPLSNLEVSRARPDKEPFIVSHKIP